jgi:hypothetical protein
MQVSGTAGVLFVVCEMVTSLWQEGVEEGEIGGVLFCLDHVTVLHGRMS